MLLFLLVLSPKNLLFIRGISLQVFINPLLLLILLLSIANLLKFEGERIVSENEQPELHKEFKLANSLDEKTV
jgi:hypothetical protein